MYYSRAGSNLRIETHKTKSLLYRYFVWNISAASDRLSQFIVLSISRN